MKLIRNISDERIVDAEVEFLTPYRNGGGLTRIAEACAARHLWPQRAGDDVLGGLVRAYPAGKYIIRFNINGDDSGNIDNATDRLQYEVPFVSATGTNQSSILIYTSTQPALKGAVFFTGDSSSWKISPVIHNNTLAGQLPHLAIYKIQHHGRANDSIFDALARPITLAEEILIESSVSMLLNRAIHAVYPRFWDETHNLELVDHLAAWVVQEAHPDPQGLLNILDQRRRLLIHKAFRWPAGGTISHTAVPLPAWPQGVSNPRKVLTNAIASTKSNNWWSSY